METLHNDGKFEFTYSRDAAASYLVVTAGAHEKVWDYQLEMIASNQIKYILPMDARRKDDKVSFYCNITSKLPLSQFLKKRKIHRDEFLSILSGIARALLDCRNYFLKDRCFLLKEDFIYINPASLEISMAYIPVDTGEDAAGRYREFVINLIMCSADLEEDSGDNFLQRILSYVKSDTFSIIGFSRLLNELSGIGVLPEEKDAGVLQEQSIQKKCTQEKSYQKMCTQGNGPQENAVDDAILESLSVHLSAENGLKQESKKNNGHSRRINFKPVVVAVLAQAMIVALIFACRDFIESLEGNTTTAYAGVAIIVLALDILLLKRLFGNSSLVIKQTQDQTKQSRDQSRNGADSGKSTGFAGIARGLADIAGEITEVAGNMEDEDGIVGGIAEKAEELKEQMHQVDLAAREAAAADDRRCETVFLAQSGDLYPYLLGEDGNPVAKISITKPDFAIGRLEGQVDYVCRNRAVGKVHARVISRDGAYFLVDMNSKNGTYINGVRIDSNKEYEIRNNDRIMFANSGFVFIVPAAFCKNHNPGKASGHGDGSFG